MKFYEFAQRLHPIIGGASSTHAFAKTLFSTIITEDGSSVLEEVSEESYKAYYNGNTSISRMAKKISPYVDSEEFVGFCNQFQDGVTERLCDSFREFCPNINAHNAGEELAALFKQIVNEAAATKRKSTSKGAKVGNSSGNVSDWAALSSEDMTHLKSFRADSRDILVYIIRNDPSAGPTAVSLPDEIGDLVEKWRFSVREIENNAFRTLVLDILGTLSDYTYYISEVFLRYIPGRNILWFRNESWEEGNRLRDELQPKSYELRCKIARLYEKLYPIPEDADQDRSETIEAEVMDDEEPSSAATEGKKTTVIQQQTNVIQNGENNFNLTNNGTMNFNL